MKILLYSSRFWPAVGGVEATAEALAASLAQLGAEVTIVTETVSASEREAPFRIVRRPAKSVRLELARAADVIHSIGASLALYPYAILAHRPFLWTHTGYQVSCVDGLGWRSGKPAPMTPWASLRVELEQSGVRSFLIEGLKLMLRRTAAHCVKRNVFQTRWVMNRLKLPRAVLACTPYPLEQFRGAACDLKYDFIFVGRLVSEKGAADLLYAFAEIASSGSRLAVVGDGPLRRELEETAKVLGLASQVSFLGELQGEALVRVVSEARIGVVPSVWEEPLGGVALELLAAGKNIIVSARGGMTEIVGAAGLTFPNGDRKALAEAMRRLRSDSELCERQRLAAASQLALYEESVLALRYLDLYGEVRTEGGRC